MLPFCKLFEAKIGSGLLLKHSFGIVHTPLKKLGVKEGEGICLKGVYFWELTVNNILARVHSKHSLTMNTYKVPN